MKMMIAGTIKLRIDLLITKIGEKIATESL